MFSVDQLSYMAELCLPQNGLRREAAGPSSRTPEEWDQLLREADRVGVFPAVFQSLRRSGSVFAEREDSSSERKSRAIVARNLVLRKTQEELLASLAVTGLRCQPIKGVRLAQYLYGGLGWRESFDIDLICPAGEVPGVYAKLRSLGLRDAADSWTEPGLRRALSQPEFMFPEIKLTAVNGTLVELHWDWTGEAFPEGDPLEDKEAYAVYLCRHAAKHFWSSLQWVCDIELLLRASHGCFEWRRFWKLAWRANAVRDCAASLEICKELFASAFARQVSLLHRGPARRLARSAINALADPAGREETRAHPARRLLQVDGWYRRIWRCWHWLAPAPRSYNQVRTGSASIVEVWLARYWRLARSAIRFPAGLARWRRRLATVSRLTPSDWVDIALASLLLTRTKLALSKRPLTEVARLATRSNVVAPDGTPARIREIVYRTDHAVRLAARVHPAEMKCLPRALVLAKLLAARGIAVDLKLGVRREDGQFAGHAWVEWNGELVNETASVAATYAGLSHSLDRSRDVFDAASA